MNHFIKICLLAIAGQLVSSCALDLDYGCRDGNGRPEFEDRSVRNFYGVELSDNIELVLARGNTGLSVEAESNLLNEVRTEVRNGILFISLRNCVRSRRPVRVFVSSPELTYLANFGSGDIFSDNTLFSEELEIRSEGSGQINLTLNTDYLRLRNGGSGNIRLDGTAEEQVIDLEASGNLEAFNLRTFLLRYFGIRLRECPIAHRRRITCKNQRERLGLLSRISLSDPNGHQRKR